MGAPRSCSAMHDTGKDHTCDDFVTPGHDSLPKTCEDHYDNCASPPADRRAPFAFVTVRSGPCCAASLLPAQQALTALTAGPRPEQTNSASVASTTSAPSTSSPSPPTSPWSTPRRRPSSRRTSATCSGRRCPQHDAMHLEFSPPSYKILAFSIQAPETRSGRPQMRRI